MIEDGQQIMSRQPASGRMDYSFDPITDVMLGGSLYKGLTKSSLADDAAKALVKNDDQMVTLFRGVNENHVGFDDAANGIAIPRGGPANAIEHNADNTQSPFTSWTIDPDVARNFALRPDGKGVMLEITVPKSTIFESPSLKDVVLKQSGKIVNESENLLKGTIKDAKVTEIKN
jgi:hypothetical protein